VHKKIQGEDSMNRPTHGRLARSLALAASSFACAAPAPADTTIWRCGNTYSDIPCAGGATVETPAGPSAEQRRQADQATRRNQAAAARMQRERVRLEAAGARRGALVIGPAARTPPSAKKDKPPAKAAKPGLHSHKDDFVATQPSSPGAPARNKKKN